MIYELLFKFRQCFTVGEQRFYYHSRKGFITIANTGDAEPDLYHTQDGVSYRFGGYPHPPRTESPWGLMATCKAIHEEATAAFYQANAFQINVKLTYHTRSTLAFPQFVDLAKVRQLFVTLTLEGCRKSRRPSERALFAEYFLDWTILRKLSALQQFRLQIMWTAVCPHCKTGHFPRPYDEAWLEKPFLIDIVTGAIRYIKIDVRVAMGTVSGIALAGERAILVDKIQKERKAQGLPLFRVPTNFSLCEKVFRELGKKYRHLLGKDAAL